MEYLFDQISFYFSSAPIWRWLAVIAVSVLLTLMIKLVLGFISKRVRKWVSQTHFFWDDIAPNIIDGLKTPVLFFIIFYLLSTSLQRTETTEKIFTFLVICAISLQIAYWGLYLLRVWNEHVLKRKIEVDPSSAAALSLLNTALQGIFLIIVFLIALSNLGVNVTALVTGLGVGGIAVALAAQNILGDFLASLSIALDKPFVVGDFIANDQLAGTVEAIGIKTTRVRSIAGEQVVLSNKDLLESRLQNYKRMQERRVVQTVGVLYNTPTAVLREIPSWIKEIIEKQNTCRFDRCHLMNFDDSWLKFEFVFYILSAEYNVFMDAQQVILLEILERFEREKVGIAYPSRSIYLEQMPKIDIKTAEVTENRS